MSLPSMVVDAHLEAVSFSLYSDAEVQRFVLPGDAVTRVSRLLLQRSAHLV